MKVITKNISSLVLTIGFLLLIFNVSSQGVGINPTGATPDNSALLDLNSTDKGFLITRVDTVDIALPAFGLMTLAPLDSCLYMFSGIAWVSIGGAGSDCSCNYPSTPQPPITPYCGPDTITQVVDVLNPVTGDTWMDRNLGASQVAASSDDIDAYGDLYQWGRCSDGHEKRNSNTITILSVSDTPGNSNFIIETTDWRSSQNDDLWQGVGGINNPCPSGYRLPTEAEFIAEISSWGGVLNPTGAYNSPLKLTTAGTRDQATGALGYLGYGGTYWSSTISGPNARFINFFGVNSNNQLVHSYSRAYGLSVRCIKD